MIQDRVKAAAFGSAGRGQVEREFNASLMADRTAAMYESLWNR